jgi:formyltetrahydrofolate deformylase
MSASYILLLSCPDQRGIVHAVTGFLMDQGGNITEAAQFDDKATGLFFMRVQFDIAAPSESLLADFEPVRGRFDMQAQFYDAVRPTPTVIMVSQNGQCLNHLLFRNRSGLLNLDVRAIVSNHRDFYQLAASYNIPFHHVPVSAVTKPAAEAKLLEIFKAEGAELLVLARYMQILSDEVCKKLHGKAINIHHSFLPSFKGAKPYYQAHDRGVKLTGATAHYVTGDLDEGPIIEQDVARVDHAMTPETLTSLGGDTECIVLTRAVKWHSEHRILLNGHKTVVFK